MAKAIPVHPEDEAVETQVESTPTPEKELVPVTTPAGEQPKVASPFKREDY